MIGKGAIIYVIGFATILGYLALNLNQLALDTVDNMATYADVTGSHNLASAGANVGLAKFYQDTTWFGTITETIPSGPLRGSFAVTMENVGVNTARLRSVSSYPGAYGGTLKDTIEVSFDKSSYNSFSMFAWMTNFEGNVFWITGDTVWGRVHSNGNLHVNGRPVFWQKVTTAKGFDPKPGKGTNKAIFKDGYETGIASIAFPNSLAEIIAASTAGGRTYAGDIWVTLSPGAAGSGNGMAYIRNSMAGAIIDSISLYDPSFNGVILGSGRVNVHGTLDGQLSIGSLQDVYIQNDIVYEQNPRIVTSSDDMLGLVAEQNVVVAENVPNSSNCEIQASIFCRTGSFQAEDYNSRGIDGELRILGSIIQNTRGAVGTFSGSSLNSGFSKRYRFDDRLADSKVRPPYFPGFYVRTYAIKNWWESYRIPHYE